VLQLANANKLALIRIVFIFIFSIQESIGKR